MKLFDNFEAVKFPEENLILITHNGYLYYIYDYKYQHWSKHKNAGNDHITVQNYPDVNKEELVKVFGGIYPTKETDFLKFCHPSQLHIVNLLNLLSEDYSSLMSDECIHDFILEFLSKSDICYKSYIKVKELFDNAIALNLDKAELILQIKELCFNTIGRNIFKKEIEIIDGHDCSSYFWIQPVRIIDFSNTNEIDNVAEMQSLEISIEEDDVDQYLTLFFYKYFDNNIEANKKRLTYDDISYNGFEWYLTHNFYTFESIGNILKDIRDTIEALSSGKENEYTIKLRESDTETELIIDFYRRFIYRMEYMVKVGKEKGYNLISFMGP